jgi:DmsE family decaheme c-type cytochrome
MHLRQPFLAVGVICAALSGLSVAVRANDPQPLEQSTSAQRKYFQLVAVTHTPTAEGVYDEPNTVRRNQLDDIVYASLREFIQRIGTNPPAPTAERPKLAEADNAFDALREFFQNHQNQNGTIPPQQPNAPAPPAAKPKASDKPNAPAVQATTVGSKVCVGCHSSQADTFGYTLMGRLQKQGKLECETCHGPGSAHVNAGGGLGVGGIISFRPDDTSRTAEENNAICLDCHKRGDRTYWDGSVHQERGLACSDCHTVMRNVSAHSNLKTAFEPNTCFQCHKRERAQLFLASSHAMREGKVACSDCHNPHGSVTEALLKETSVNDNCYKCHAETRGPFLFEHEPVRENCLSCHVPHGSVNEYLLKLSRPRLCFECHGFGHGSATAGVNSVFTMGRSCQNCHTAIHGSNSPAGGVFQR